MLEFDRNVLTSMLTRNNGMITIPMCAIQLASVSLLFRIHTSSKMASRYPPAKFHIGCDVGCNYLLLPTL